MQERRPRFLKGGLITIFAASLCLTWGPGALHSSEIKLPPLRVRVGERAPDFALANSSGKMVRLSDFRGRKVLIDFYRGYW